MASSAAMCKRPAACGRSPAILLRLKNSSFPRRYEAMSDLVYILGTLVEKDGRILIDGIYDEVAPETDEERRAIETISLDVDALRTNLGAKKLTYNEDKVQLLLHRWRYPSLSIHGIEGAYSEPGTKTIIPHKVTGRFSIRLVPNQTPDSVAPLVFKHLNAKWEERGSPNAFRTFLANSGKPWISDPTHPNYEAARKATKHAYRVEPDFTREGGSIPVAMTLQNATGKNVLLIPVGAGDDGAHSQNEKIDIRNYIGGVSASRIPSLSHQTIRNYSLFSRLNFLVPICMRLQNWNEIL